MGKHVARTPLPCSGCSSGRGPTTDAGHSKETLLGEVAAGVNDSKPVAGVDPLLSQAKKRGARVGAGSNNEDVREEIVGVDTPRREAPRHAAGVSKVKMHRAVSF